MSAALRDIPVKDINGAPRSLRDYSGKVLLVVNVASKCGLTPQYSALEQLYRDKKSRGLEVLGFPANDFAGQEPGTEAEIADFCSTNYDISFPMFSKIKVTGQETHALYRELTSAQPKAQGDPVDLRTGNIAMTIMMTQDGFAMTGTLSTAFCSCSTCQDTI